MCYKADKNMCVFVALLGLIYTLHTYICTIYTYIMEIIHAKTASDEYKTKEYAICLQYGHMRNYNNNPYGQMFLIGRQNSGSRRFSHINAYEKKKKIYIRVYTLIR